ncbi:protein lin-28 homolog [Calliphora vicina]|uniref:protein lin-28 homolog n=1 Tax=Calliphora vicina TaxID=7373 RepID=UPI00325C21E2
MINTNSKATSMENDSGNQSPVQSTNSHDDNTFESGTIGSLTSLSIDPQEIEGVHYGKCKWFNVAKGWGFITPNNGGPEVFVHQSVIQMIGFRSLAEQEDVEYECHMTKRGLEATRVSGRQGNDCHGSTFRPRFKKSNRRLRCYNCGKFANHLASKCKLEPQPKRCHLCQQEDHLFATCPSSKQNSRNDSQPHTTNDEHSFASEHDINNLPDLTDESR